MTTALSNTFKLRVLSSAWTPPYTVPSAPGQVVTIAGDASGLNYTSSYVPSDGKCVSDVKPTEYGLGNWNSACMCDSSMAYISSYSQGGAMVTAGAGGHHGPPQFGAIAFDLQDGKWKRHYTGGVTTTQISGAVSRVMGVNPGIRQSDLFECYSNSAGLANICPNPNEWAPAGLETTYCPRVADPRQQTWEVSVEEPYPYSATTVTQTIGAYVVTVSGPHGWTFPGQWAGLNGAPITGYVVPSAMYSPTGANAAYPEVGQPTPCHAWATYFEHTTAAGGGTQGSIVIGRHIHGADKAAGGSTYSHAFDLSSGRWSLFSTNKTGGYNVPAGTVANAGYSQIALAHDPIKQRVFLIANPAVSTMNYMNLSDKTWRSISGASRPAGTNRTESLSVDPVRRLLICQDDLGHIQALDLSVLADGNPTSITPEFKNLPVTIASGFQDAWDGVWQWKTSIGPTDPNALFRGGAKSRFNLNWFYYPPNGKYYRLAPLAPVDVGYSSDVNAYWGITGTPPIAGTAGFGGTEGTVQRLQRLTPPAIISNPPAGYYNSPTSSWTFDEITLSTPMCLPSPGQARMSVPRRFFYADSIQCFVYMPMDGTAAEPYYRRPVYLIKPF